MGLQKRLFFLFLFFSQTLFGCCCFATPEEKLARALGQKKHDTILTLLKDRRLNILHYNEDDMRGSVISTLLYQGITSEDSLVKRFFVDYFKENVKAYWSRGHVRHNKELLLKVLFALDDVALFKWFIEHDTTTRKHYKYIFSKPAGRALYRQYAKQTIRAQFDGIFNLKCDTLHASAHKHLSSLDLL